MLRLTTDQPDFWDYLLPEEARRMHPELRVVDAVLDDQRFLEPFRGAARPVGAGTPSPWKPICG